jgi:hypothetical protein
VREELSHVLTRLSPRAAILANAADQNDGLSWLARQAHAVLSVMMCAQRKRECIGVTVVDRRSSDT